MHVALNALSITNQSGTGRYAWGLIHGFSQLEWNGFQLSVLIPSDFPIPKAWWSAKHIRFYSIPARFTTQRIYWEQCHMSRFLDPLNVDILHSPSFIAPLFGAKQLIHIITIHDLTFLKFPQTIPNNTRVYYKTTIPRSIRKAKTVITDSQTVADELQETSYPIEKVAPIHLGVDPTLFHRNGEGDQAVLKQYGVSQPYYLFVGTREPRKNLMLAAQAYREARKRGMNTLLVVVGRLGWMQDESIFEQPEMQALGHVPNEHLPALYRNAHALLAPSMYEGYDLPIAETYACGTPVIASDIPVHHEIAGPQAKYVGINSVTAWAETLKHAAEQPKQEVNMPVRNWRNVAEEVYEVYADAVKR